MMIGRRRMTVAPVTVIFWRSTMDIGKFFEENSAIIEKLARVSELRFPDVLTTGLAKHATAAFEMAAVYERKIDVPAERERLAKEIVRLEKAMQSANVRLANVGFMSKAPAHIVDGLKKQAAETGMLLAKAMGELEALPKK